MAMLLIAAYENDVTVIMVKAHIGGEGGVKKKITS